MNNKLVRTTMGNDTIKYYIVGDIINLKEHNFKQKVELRAYTTKDDEMIGMCDFAISQNNVGTLCYIEVKQAYMQNHVGTALINIMHNYLAKNGVESVNGLFSPVLRHKWAAESFYRNNKYVILFDEYLFRRINDNDLKNQDNCTWHTTTITPSAKLLPIEDITVNKPLVQDDEDCLTLKQ